MRFPRKTVEDIPVQPLPSLLTLVHRDQKSPTQVLSGNLSNTIEDGIELVPIERQDTSCAKIFTPGQDEKEVVISLKLDIESVEKPLPIASRSLWSRLSITSRIIAILCVQFCTILTIGLSLMSMGRKGAYSAPQSELQPNTSQAPPPITPSFPIQRGDFTVQTITPQTQNSACLAQSNESVAWVCFPNTLGVNILPPPAGQANSLVSLEYTDPASAPKYGLRPFKTSSTLLTPATDSQFPNLGPGLYFRTTYDRTVLFLEDRIVAQGSTPNLRENWGDSVYPGDRPWLCTFNETVIEGYIYTSQNASRNDTIVLGGGLNGFRRVQSLPYVIKIIEQRVPNSPQPFCLRMQTIDTNSTLVPEGDAGAMNLLKLSEVVTQPRSLDGNAVPGARLAKRQRMMAANTCRCQWMVQ